MASFPASQRASDSDAPRQTARRRKREPVVAHHLPACLPENPWYLRCKQLIEWCLALLLFVATLPLLALAALAVKLTSRGPAFYTQTRVGRNGRLFTILKLRTMIHNCESLTGARWAIPGDPRVTPIGRILRLSHLDELPQLVNVLRGEMALIGPRPERPEFTVQLEKALPAYSERLQVRPGVTGFAQIQLPADTSLVSVRRKLAYDLYYIQRANPWFDCRILLGTALKAVAVPFPLVRALLWLPTEAVVERATRPWMMPDVAADRTRRARPRVA